MELRVLRYFLSIVEEGSISAAAEAMHVTQPTISRQIIELENELRIELFQHNRHPLTLTPTGSLFFQRAQVIVELAGKMELEFKRSDLICGTIGIGAVESLGTSILAQVLSRFSADNPNVQYHIYTGFADDIKNQLDCGLLDIGILVEPVEYDKYQTQRLPITDPWGILMRAEDPLAAVDAIHLEDVLELPLIVPQRAVTPTGKKAWLGNAIKDSRIIATYNILSNAALLAQSGIGYAVCHYGGAFPRLNAGLRFVPLTPQRTSESVLVWKKERVQNPAVSLLLDTFKQVLGAVL